MRVVRTSAASSLLLAATAGIASAQIRASELGGVSQTIDGTRIAIEYSRPRVRGRAPLFGENAVVHWGEVWTPGANYATTLEVNKPFTLDRHSIDKGKYSMRLVVRARDWTMVLDPDVRRFHTEPPDSNAKQIRWAVHPSEGPLEEELSFRFTELSVNGAKLRLEWGTMRVVMQVAVSPSLRMTTPTDEAAPFLGRYSFTYEAPDSRKYVTTLGHEHGYLLGHNAPNTDWLVDYALIRVATDWYTFGLFENGAIYEVETTSVLEFKRDANGKVTGLEVRDDSDTLMVRGARIP